MCPSMNWIKINVGSANFKYKGIFGSIGILLGTNNGSLNFPFEYIEAWPWCKFSCLVC